MGRQLILSTTVLIILAPPLIVATQNLTTTKSSTETDNSEEYENELVTGLRNEYRNGFATFLTNVKLTNTAIQKLAEKISHVEMQHSLKADVEREFGNKLQQLQTDMLIRIVQTLSETQIGTSFGGKTLNEISENIGIGRTAAVQIKNHLKVSLSGHKLWWAGTVSVISAPRVINPRMAEVFTFKNKTEVIYPECSFFYRVGGTEFALHTYFASKTTERRLAIAFLKDNDNSQALWQATSRNNLTSNPTAFASTNGWVNNATQEPILNVIEGDLRARAIMKYVSDGKFTLSIEVFEIGDF